MPVTKKAGKGGTVTIGTTVISIRTWELSISSDYQDVTASDNYDELTDTLWKDQESGPTSASGTIEGVFDLTTLTGTSAQVIQKIIAGTAAACVFNLTRDDVFGHGNFNLNEGSVSLDVNGELTFSASTMSKGVFTLGAPVP